MANRSFVLPSFALSSILVTALSSGSASAFELASGYPQRTGTSRVAPTPDQFSLSATNAGINRADCFDAAQRYRFSFTDVPSDASAIEVWARSDGTSCASPDARKSDCFRVVHWDLGATPTSALEVDPQSIVQAIEKKKSVDSLLAAKDVCNKTTHSMPTTVHLHLMAVDASGSVIGYSSGEGSKPAEIDYQTLYDLGAPAAPTKLSLGAGEGLLTVKFTAPSPTPGDFLGYRVYCTHQKPTSTTSTASDAGVGDAAEAGADAAKTSTLTTSCPTHPFVAGTLPDGTLDAYLCGESSSVAGDIPLDSVVNDEPYAVAIATVDKQGNVGVLSDVVCETPRATDSFWDNYRAAGGQAGGGCAHGAPRAELGALGLAMLCLAVLVLRRRAAREAKAATIAAVVACTLGAASHARADDSVVVLEARFGPYRPNVDGRFERAKPYAKTFGDGRNLMSGAEVDYTPVHFDRIGTIGFGGLLGYTSASAKARFTSGGKKSDEDTSFDLWVLGLVTTFRLTALAERTRAPFVPYAKVGLVNGFWSASDAHGVSESPDGLTAHGRTNGFFYAAGAMLLLDVFDPEAAKTFAAERGVKHSYVFGEFTVADLRGFGQTYPMWVGDKTWTMGLALEM